MKVHHATQKKADRLGIVIMPPDHTTTQWSASHIDLPKLVYANAANDAVDLAAMQLGDKSGKAGVARRVKKAHAPKTPKVRKPKKAKPEAKADVQANRSVVKKVYKERYAKAGGNSGSPIAKALSDALLGEGPGVIERLCKENGIPFAWRHLDIGRQRMCLGTVLKGKDRRGEIVLILGKKVKNPVEDGEDGE